MPRRRFLASIVVFFPLLLLSVSAHFHHHRRRHHNHHYGGRRTRPGFNLTGRPKPSLSRQFLDAHNLVRLQLNEQPLIWDRSLARYARRWGAQRAGDCQMLHSYGPYGENIFWAGQDHWTATEAVQSWVRENQFYNPETNQCDPGQMCGHYTQVVWKGSSRVGCSKVKCLTGGILYICEYDPPGNYVNENPFGKLFSGAGEPPANTAATSY